MSGFCGCGAFVMLAFSPLQNNARKFVTALLRIRHFPSLFAVSTIQRTMHARLRLHIVSTFCAHLRQSMRLLCAAFGMERAAELRGGGWLSGAEHSGGWRCLWASPRSKAAKISDVREFICDNGSKVFCEGAKLVRSDRRWRFFNNIYVLVASRKNCDTIKLLKFHFFITQIVECDCIRDIKLIFYAH